MRESRVVTQASLSACFERRNPEQARLPASRRRAFKVEQNKTTRVEEPMSNDHGPKIASRRKNNEPHYHTQCAGDGDAERILIRVRRSKKRALHQTCGKPGPTAGTEKHCQSLHKESAKREFLVKARADECVQNAIHRDFQISLHILEFGEVATKPRLFRKIHGDENNCGQPTPMTNVR